MSFFPDKIETEAVSRYTKLGQGTTKLRFLGSPLFGYETWLEDSTGAKSPKRFGLDEEIKQSECGPDGVKQFMAIKVYNYGAKAIQIFQVTQKSILKAIKEYSENMDYGKPTGYDISITRKGEGMKTSYSVIASPPKEASKEVLEADADLYVELENLLINADPFTK